VDHVAKSAGLAKVAGAYCAAFVRRVARIGDVRAFATRAKGAFMAWQLVHLLPLGSLVGWNPYFLYALVVCHFQTMQQKSKKVAVLSNCRNINPERVDTIPQTNTATTGRRLCRR